MNDGIKQTTEYIDEIKESRPIRRAYFVVFDGRESKSSINYDHSNVPAGLQLHLRILEKVTFEIDNIHPA